MSKDTFTILTRREKKASHRTTEVTIDWDGITEYQLRLLARNALIHDLQAQIQKKDEVFPEKVTLIARERVFLEPPSLVKFMPVKRAVEVKVSKGLEDLLKNLTKEELRELLG